MEPGLELTVAMLTKRELFAALAMAGLLATDTRFAEPETFTGYAIGMADALLAALKGGE